MAKVYQTPGVYVEERNAFPNSAVLVATAVPAFIGYTEKAVRNEKSLTNVPTKISSYGEYLLFFGGAPKTKFTLFASAEAGVPYKLAITGSYFTLHSQMKMFFSNGGSDCYIVSVGGYTQKADGTAIEKDRDGYGSKRKRINGDLTGRQPAVQSGDERRTGSTQPAAAQRSDGRHLFHGGQQRRGCFSRRPTLA